jgi:hypothetical protein
LFVQDTVANLQNIFATLNKTDLEAVFDSTVPEKWAQDHAFKFFQTSAKDKRTVDPLFQLVAESLINHRKLSDVQRLPQGTKKASGCCR